MTTLIKKITIKHKLNKLYHKVKDEYESMVEKFDNSKVSVASAAMSLVGLVGYASDMYTHIFVANGILKVNVYNDKKFAKLLKTIKDKADNLNAELIEKQVKLGKKR